jgi:putative membrane protein
MFIDYVTLMLINMAAGLFILALYVVRGSGDEDQGKWSLGFTASGLVALVTGFYTTLTWPLPGSFNMAFGELSVLFGTIYLAGALAMARGIKASMVTIYALFGGLAAVVIGAGIIEGDMTKAPLIAGTGFIVTGLGGILSYPYLRLRGNRTVRAIACMAMLTAALIWSLIGYMAYWDHLKSFATWHPETMREVTKGTP